MITYVWVGSICGDLSIFALHPEDLPRIELKSQVLSMVKRGLLELVLQPKVIMSGVRIFSLRANSVWETLTPREHLQKRWWSRSKLFSSTTFSHPSPHPSFSHPARVWIYWDRDARLIRTVSGSLGNQGAQRAAKRGAKKLINHLGGMGSMLQLKRIIYWKTDKEETTSR